jgi:hypothetical protein
LRKSLSMALMPTMCEEDISTRFIGLQACKYTGGIKPNGEEASVGCVLCIPEQNVSKMILMSSVLTNADSILWIHMKSDQPCDTHIGLTFKHVSSRALC